MREPTYVFCPICSCRLQWRRVENRLRQHCPNCQWLKYLHTPQAGVAVVRQGNQILLVQRARPPLAKRWMVPGGFAEYGELPFQTALRELQEETGLQARTWAHLGQYLSTDHPRTNSLVTAIAVTVDYAQSTLVAQDDVSAAQWFDIDHLPKLAFACHRQLVTDFYNWPANLIYHHLPTRKAR